MGRRTGRGTTPLQCPYCGERRGFGSLGVANGKEFKRCKWCGGDFTVSTQKPDRSTGHIYDELLERLRKIDADAADDFRARTIRNPDMDDDEMFELLDEMLDILKKYYERRVEEADECEDRVREARDQGEEDGKSSVIDNLSDWIPEDWCDDARDSGVDEGRKDVINDPWGYMDEDQECINSRQSEFDQGYDDGYEDRDNNKPPDARHHPNRPK